MMISVIIPSYNRAHIIEKSIRSVMNQTYSDLEIIVVDDCSNDNTADVVKRINDDRIRYICLDKNSGACVARNRGILEAKGNYIAFQDSDDEWHKDKIEKQLNVLLEKGVDIVFCALNKVYDDGTTSIIPHNKKEGIYTQRELIYESMASTQTIIGRANVIKMVEFDQTLPRMQDYDFIIRASEEFSVYYMDEVLVNVYEQPDSITASKKQYLKRLEITEKLLEKYAKLTSIYPEWELKMKKTVVHCKIMLGYDVAKDLKYIFYKEKNLTNGIKIMLAKLRMLRFVMQWRDNRK